MGKSDQSSTCDYFQSEEWEARLYEDIKKEWNANDLVWQLEDVEDLDDFNNICGDIEDELGIGKNRLQEMEVDDFVEQDKGVLELTMEDVRQFWEEEHELPNECPHPPVGESRFCIFHRDVGKKSDTKVQRELLDIIQSDSNIGERKKVFTGAKFGDLNLKYANFVSAHNSPVDLQYAIVQKQFTFSEALIQKPLKLHRLTCKGEARFDKSKFEREVDASRAIFENGAHFVGTTFEGRAEFSEVEFQKSGNFERAIFEDEAWFYGTVFSGFCFFIHVSFNRDAIFSYSKLNHTDFSYAYFYGKASFEKAVFFSRGGMGGTKFNDEARFEEAVCLGRAIDFNDAYINDGLFSLPKGRGDPYYNDTKTYYDFSNAVIGDIELRNDNPDEIFDHFRIYNTEFEEFQFDKYSSNLSPEWNLHTFKGEFRPNQDPEDVSMLLSTYLKAKNSAKQVGDLEAASEFFVKEMRYRRKQYLETRKKDNVSRYKSMKLWGKSKGNWILDKTTQYGEKPWRVFILSVIIIVGSSIIYPITDGIRTSGGDVLQYTGDGLILIFWKFLYFSTVTFTTVGYGDLQPVGTAAQAIAAVESFTGAFLMALLIFVLGRSIKW